MDRMKESRRTLLICLLLAAATLAAFWPVIHSDFIHYDDPQYVTLNPHVASGLTWANVKWAFSSGYASNWHPLTWLSHMLDAQLFGLKAGGHHLTNLIFHVLNTLLLFLLLKRMTGALWRSAFVAALFALHPLHVESVAWVAERKDVLSAFFFFLTLLAYAKYVETRNRPAASGLQNRKPDHASRFTLHASLFYSLALLSFALGLMSKPMLVTLPFVLLLLDFWPLGRFQPATFNLQPSTILQLLREKLPFLVLSILSCAVTLRVQTQAMVDPNALPSHARLENAAMVYVTYLRQTFWPTRLAIFYPYPTAFSDVQVIGAAALVLSLTAAAVFLARRRPFIAVGWFWYLGMMVPTAGVVQVGSQARADRYTYLPLIGIFILVSWGLASIQKSEVTSQPRKLSGSRLETDQDFPRFAALAARAKGLLAGGAVLVLIALGMTAHQQVEHWRNSETLFKHAAAVTQENYVAWGGLGIVDLRRDDPASAMPKLNRAFEYAEPHGATGGIKFYIGMALQMQGKGIEALPYLQESTPSPEQLPERSYRVGLSLVEVGRLAEAETALRQAIEARPDNPEYQMGMAALFQNQGQTAKAEQLFRDVVGNHPELAQARKSFADFLMLLDRPAEAEIQYAAAVKLQPRDVKLRRGYYTAFARQGKTIAAIQQVEEVLKLEPSNAQANFDLAELLSQQGKSREAVARYNQAIEADPKLISALNNLAWLLATDPDEHVRNGPRAVELAERACQLTEWKQAFLMGTLAAAYAEAGRFAEAVATAEKARDKARLDKLEEVAKRNEELLQLYRAGKAYRETEPLINTNRHE